MKRTKATTELICHLEEIIGNQCYNPHSTDGYLGVEGLEFRYPVYYENKNGVEARTKYSIDDIDKSKLDTIKYKFGSNHLNIGTGLIAVLEHLERTYDLDFNELEKSKQKK